VQVTIGAVGKGSRACRTRKDMDFCEPKKACHQKLVILSIGEADARDRTRASGVDAVERNTQAVVSVTVPAGCIVAPNRRTVPYPA